ncbi:hypothetical protein LCGC14_0985450 [marine sediment metagenome]|uniref:Uncharacterized protein n=1 Tax=marine sediment metagenome TaxID=412755 RepID=A0A0F9NBV2_9ZZZZ
MSNTNSEIKSQIDVAAYYLAQENYTYDKLCWMFAQRRLRAEKDTRYNQEERIKEKAAEIYFQSTPYDILCYLIAELDVLINLGAI